MTAGFVINSLAQKFTAPEYAFLTEVRNQTGFNKVVRSADAVAMSLWPSRGLYLTGFEVKVSRADWVKELKDPAKAEEIARFCRNWFVAAPLGLIKAEEVPDAWGLIEIRESGVLKYAKPAKAQQEQEPTWQFFASLLRNVNETWVASSIVEKRISDRVEERKKQLEQGRQYEESGAQRQLRELLQAVAAFESASGIKVQSWDAGKVGEAVKVLRSMGTGNVLDRLIQAKGQLQSLVKAVEDFEAQMLSSAVPSCRSRYRGYPCNKQIHTEGTLHTDGLPDGCSWQTAQEDQPQL